MDFDDDLDYDPYDERSILEYAARLTGHTLGQMGGAKGSAVIGEPGARVKVIGGTETKGYFGQALEKGYFGIKNNSRPEPDFADAGIELKVSPMKEERNGLMVKERMVLGIMDYNKVPDMGFRTFTDKNSHILIVFYLWHKGEGIMDYPVLKVVDWVPSEQDLRMIHEDWDIIEGFIERGEAHLLSERHTKLLAACTKGAGHGGDLRTQPFSPLLAKQRALSFKPGFVKTIYDECPDLNDVLIEGTDPVEPVGVPEERVRRLSVPAPEPDYGTVFRDHWSEGVNFEMYVLNRFQRFVGMDCADIEHELGIELSDSAKSYYHTLVLAMMGVFGKKHVREFVQADILLKTIRLKLNGASKESMSFPAFRYDELIEQDWEDSDFYEQLDHIFFMPVFQFPTADTSIGRKGLVFRGAFFWAIPEEDFSTVRGVWEDTRDKIDAGVMDDFIKSSDGRISHVRPHARDSSDTFPFRGKEYVKKSFWLNADYIADVVRRNLGGPRSTR